MPMHTKIREAYERVGETRVLFGTDVPFHHPVVEIAKVRVSGLPPEAVERVLSKNGRAALLRRRERDRAGGRVTLPPFDLHRARSVDEAHELLDRYGEDAAVVCGGTELLLLLKLGFAAYGHLVDIKGIEELGGIRAENGTLVIGSTVTHREIERSPLVLERLPALAAMERDVANIRVRNVGTLGGNLCFSDPHSDPATFLLALDAEVEHDGGRMPLSEFLVGPYETALEHGQLLRAVRIPIPARERASPTASSPSTSVPPRRSRPPSRWRAGRSPSARITVGSVGARPVRGSRRRCPGRKADHGHAGARRGGGARRRGLRRSRGCERLGRVQAAARSRPGRALRQGCRGRSSGITVDPEDRVVGRYAVEICA